MSNSELDEIMASVQAAISRAYALGRLHALKHVITTMEAEETQTAAKQPLALMAPQPNAPPPVPEPAFTPSPEPALVPSPEPAAATPHESPAPSKVTVVQAHPDLPANDDRAATSADTSIQLPWYRRPAK